MYTYPEDYGSSSGGELVYVRRAFACVAVEMERGITPLFHPQASSWMHSDPSKKYVWRVRLEMRPNSNDEETKPYFVSDFGEHLGELGGGGAFRERCDYALCTEYEEKVIDYSADPRPMYIKNQTFIRTGEIGVYLKSDHSKTEQHRLAKIITENFVKYVYGAFGNHYIRLDDTVFASRCNL